MTKFNLLKPIIAGLALISVSACAPGTSHYSGAETLKRNVVHHIRLSETISLKTEDGELSNDTKKQVNLFLNVNQVGFGDVISLDAGLSANSGQYNEALKKHLNRNGYQLEERAPITGIAPHEGFGILVVDRYVATPPNCHDIATHGVNIPITVQSPTFGCSNQVNLGVTVANPQDLVEPNPTANTNSEISTAAVSHYRLRIPPRGVVASSPVGRQ